MWLAFLTASAAPLGACDVPTAALAQQPAADPAACEARCAARADCGAWTFVSGWGSCKLHAPTTRHVELHLVAAVAETAADGTRTLSTALRDHDNAAKDLEASPRDLATAAECATACLGIAACQGYVYVEGYRACWLKRAVGALSPKTFTCGLRDAGAAPPSPPAASPAPDP